MALTIRSLAIRSSFLLSVWFGAQVIAQTPTTSLPAGVEKLCSIQFDRDVKRPARVEDSALHCLEEAVRRMNADVTVKLVLVGMKDLLKDHEASGNGKMRETEDTTGYDIRLEDLAAYRSLNTKGYLVRWYRVDPSRIFPTTDEAHFGQTVTFYLVPGNADFNHNYLGTTKTNERPCTVEPCYPADEESLAAQPRSRISTADRHSSSR
jgi:hypothetical protein